MRLKRVRITKGAEKFIKQRSYTIFSKWVRKLDDGVKYGDFVEVYRGKDLIGYGFYEEIGSVGVRLLAYVSENPPETLEEIIRWRVEKAHKIRIRGGEKPEAGYRLAYADSDGMPGLIIDVFNDVSVVQSTSFGWDKNLYQLAEALVELGVSEKVFVKNDQRARKLYGLPVFKRYLAGEGDGSTIIREGDAVFKVDYMRGHKTGFYLDQRPARLRISGLDLDNGTVLDLFSYNAAFAVHSLLAGASEAFIVEEDEPSTRIALENLGLNGHIAKGHVMRGRVEKVLDYLIGRKRMFDLVVVDPPAFIPSPEFADKGRRAYKVLFKNAVKAAKPGGFIYASSCSYHLSPTELLDMVKTAAESLGYEPRVVFENTPFNSNPYTRIVDQELRYLKGYLILLS